MGRGAVVRLMDASGAFAVNSILSRIMIMFPRADHPAMLEVGQRVLDEIRMRRLPQGYSSVAEHLTISIGEVSVIPPMNMTPYVLVEAADYLLYRGKNSGRNCLVTDPYGTVCARSDSA